MPRTAAPQLAQRRALRPEPAEAEELIARETNAGGAELPDLRRARARRERPAVVARQQQQRGETAAEPRPRAAPRPALEAQIVEGEHAPERREQHRAEQAGAREHHAGDGEVRHPALRGFAALLAAGHERREQPRAGGDLHGVGACLIHVEPQEGLHDEEQRQPPEAAHFPDARKGDHRRPCPQEIDRAQRPLARAEHLRAEPCGEHGERHEPLRVDPAPQRRPPGRER